MCNNGVVDDQIITRLSQQRLLRLTPVETDRRIEVRPEQPAGAHPARGSDREPRPRLSPSLQHRIRRRSSRDQPRGVSLGKRQPHRGVPRIRPRKDRFFRRYAHGRRHRESR